MSLERSPGSPHQEIERPQLTNTAKTLLKYNPPEIFLIGSDYQGGWHQRRPPQGGPVEHL